MHCIFSFRRKNWASHGMTHLKPIAVTIVKGNKNIPIKLPKDWEQNFNLKIYFQAKKPSQGKLEKMWYQSETLKQLEPTILLSLPCINKSQGCLTGTLVSSSTLWASSPFMKWRPQAYLINITDDLDRVINDLRYSQWRKEVLEKYWEYNKFMTILTMQNCTKYCLVFESHPVQCVSQSMSLKSSLGQDISSIDKTFQNKFWT